MSSEHLPPGSHHYRAYVGPPADYDLIAGISFSLLLALGLRGRHRLLDIGCGSLRVGRLLIPYLERGHYTGVEPNRWLVEDGIRQEVGDDQIRIKAPQFYFADNLDELEEKEVFDFALAQSIFSHCGADLLDGWLLALRPRLAPEGLLAATFVAGESDYTGNGWIYPDCVGYTAEGMIAAATRCGYSAARTTWRHPRQEWMLFSPSEERAIEAAAGLSTAMQSGKPHHVQNESPAPESTGRVLSSI